jgi:hypothetical protein
MPIYTGQPTLNIRQVKPSAMSWDEPGSSIDGGRNGLGMTQTIELSGGGLLVGRYECSGMNPEAHEYFNWLGARLNGSYRFINVPVLNDWSGPFAMGANGMPTAMIGDIPHSDGSTFSDGSGYSQGSVWGTMQSDAELGAGVITINVVGAARDLRWADWFSIYHDVKGWRAYRAYEFSDPTDETITVDGESVSAKRYTAKLSRPLRQAVSAGERIEFARPLCVMKFPVDFTMPWEVGDRWVMRPILEFEEAF